MKKTITGILLLIVLSAHPQTNWITLRTPESNIFGRKVDIIRNGEITFAVEGQIMSEIAFDISESADQIEEYNQQFKNFTTRYFSREKFEVMQVKSNKLTIKSLNIKSLLLLERNSKYIYSAVSADSVEIIVKRERDGRSDYTNILKDIAALFTEKNTAETITKFLPIVDSLSSSRKDTSFYKMIVKNPNVYYKVKWIKFNSVDKHDWDNRYYQRFENPRARVKSDRKDKYENKFHLIYSPLENTNSTDGIYPEMWGGGDPTYMLFRLTAKKINNELKLLIQYRKTLSGTWTDFEIGSKIEDGKKYWVLDRSLIHSFQIRRITKLVYIQVKAEQVSENTILVYNWGDSYKDKYTFMQYPEVDIQYLR